MTPLTRAFRSEVLKCRRGSMIAGTGVMLVASVFFAYLTFHQITSGAAGREVAPLAHAFPTALGLITVVGQARSFIIAVALIMVTANLAAEWSQGTWCNLLVREPRRLRLLTGKMLALLLFVLLSMTLTLVGSSVLILATATAQGVQTAAWTSSAGLGAWLAFFGNEALCLVGVCLLGLLIAVLTRSTGLAVGVALAYVLVPEGIIAMVWSEGSRWFPIRTFNFLPGAVFPPKVGPTPPQGYLAALLVALLWMLAFVVTSFVVFRRQDITAQPLSLRISLRTTASRAATDPGPHEALQQGGLVMAPSEQDEGITARRVGGTRTSGQNGSHWAGVVGNERMTALAGAVLLVLIVVELATSARIHALMAMHIVVGVLLAGPLAVKIGSTGYRFVRYYTGSLAYRRKGPPLLALRILAPLLLATTLVLLGSGIGLVITGPTQPGQLVALHNISTVIWLPLIAIHVFAYVRREPRLIADDWRGQPAAHAPGRGLRLGVNLGALLAGATAAVLVLPAAAPWVAWINTENAPAPLIAGLFVATLVLLATRPLWWK